MTTLDLSRRQFMRLSCAGLAGGLFAPPLTALEPLSTDDWDPHRPLRNQRRPLVVQPLLMYRLPVRKDETSWRSWGGIQNEADVEAEISRITGELSALAAKAEFPIQFAPVLKIQSPEDAQRARENNYDVTLLYACTGSGDLLRSCFDPPKATIIFVRHRSGPLYYWYEALSIKYLETGQSHQPAATSGVHVEDVVVDDSRELLWRLRALSAVANLKDTRIVALGGPWGKYSPAAPQIAREKFGLEIMDVSYEDLARRIRQAYADSNIMRTAELWVDRYLAIPRTQLRTRREFVTNAFVLYRIFKELMQEQHATAFTIKSCMGTIIPMSKTTACLSLGLLNDEGYAAFCESDFVVIPAGILLRYLASKPVFLHNSTFPHQGMVTCAHCTSPRRLDGRRYEPAHILTHFESDYGAAPKVEIPLGQEVTFLDPEYTVGRWVGFKGIVRDNPDLACCRSQQDVEIQGHWQQLLREVRDSHWLMVYGDYLTEAAFAARKLGVVWANLDPA